MRRVPRRGFRGFARYAAQVRRRLVLLVSPTAGGGRAGRGEPKVRARLQQHGFEVIAVRAVDAAHAEAFARGAVARGCDAVVAVGGDGTVATALQAAAGTEVPLGIVALGTGNDAAAGLGLPVGDPWKAAEVIAAWRPRRVDAAQARTGDGRHRWFLGVLSTGFDAMVNERAAQLEHWPGRTRYLAALAAGLRTFEPLPFEVTVDDRRLLGPAMFTAIGNGVRYGGGMRVCEGAVIDDGLLTMTWIHPLPKGRFVRMFPGVYRGSHVALPDVTQHVGARFRVVCDGQVAYADGERLGPLPVDVDVRPGSLQVLS